MEQTLAHDYGLTADELTRPSPPRLVDRLELVRPTLVRLAVFLGLLGAIGLLHFLMLSNTRRRHETAVLEAMGFVRSQTVAVVVWQAFRSARSARSACSSARPSASSSDDRPGSSRSTIWESSTPQRSRGSSACSLAQWLSSERRRSVSSPDGGRCVAVRRSRYAASDPTNGHSTRGDSVAVTAGESGERGSRLPRAEPASAVHRSQFPAGLFFLRLHHHLPVEVSVARWNVGASAPRTTRRGWRAGTRRTAEQRPADQGPRSLEARCGPFDDRPMSDGTPSPARPARVFALVIGALLALPALGAPGGGAGLDLGDASGCDADGHFETDLDRIESGEPWWAGTLARVAGRRPRSPAQDRPDRTCRPDHRSRGHRRGGHQRGDLDPMRVLVTAASRYGATEEIARTIAERLAQLTGPSATTGVPRS